MQFTKKYFAIGACQATTNLTVDTLSINITSTVKSLDKAATVHRLGVKLRTHEVAK